MREALHALVEREAPGTAVVNVLILDDLTELNREHRSLDEDTDVLSFPAPPTSGQLGDVAVGIGYARRQALARGVAISDEVAMLAIHGTLHLLGRDDQTDDDRRVMLDQMNALAAEFGLPTDPDWASLPHGPEEEQA